MLSGGGQNGAYGVGFLRGWGARTDTPIPRFDLITAISTGALQAPFALLGTQAAMDTLTTIYRTATDGTAPTLDWWFWIRKTGGVVNTSRYDARMRSILNSAFRDSLHAAFAQDRQVVVGTTDLDLGTGRTWDLQRELGNDSAGLVRTRAMLKAATSIPGIFPPVLVDGHVHSDGGIITNILSVLTIDDYRSMLAQVRAAGVATPVHVRLWVIINGWTHASPEAIDPSNRRKISSRWGGLSFYSHQPQVLEGLDNLARAASAELPGLTMQMRWTAVPSEVALERGADTFFNKQWMLRLEQLGEQRARAAHPWDVLVSPYVRPAPQLP